MTPDQRTTLAELPHRIRASIATWPARYRQWRADLREDPSLLWRTLAIRLALWVTLGVAVIVAARWLTHALTPPDTPGVFEKPTALATLYVACTAPACQASYTTRQPMDFSAWPMKCERCGGNSVYRRDQVCRQCRELFATAPGGSAECPNCAAKRAAQSGPAKPVASAPTRPDEDEPWP